MAAKTNPNLCFICQARPKGADGVRCDVCAAPKHVHDWKPFKFSPTSKITYYSCECGEQRMTAEEAD